MKKCINIFLFSVGNTMRKNRVKRITIQALFISSMVFTSISTASDLCKKYERMLFTCDIGKKNASICASENISPTEGYIKYRYGKSIESIELEYPLTQRAPKEAFSFAESGYAKGREIQLSFSISSYTYTLDLQSHSYGSDWSGIVVEKNKEKISELKCNMHNPGLDFADKVRHLNLAKKNIRNLGTSIPNCGNC